MPEMNRREFVALTIAGACIAGCSQNHGTGPTTQGGPIDVGISADYPLPGVYTAFLGSQKILMVQNKDHLYACSAVCTHKGCTLTFKEEVFRCPCHGSIFAVDGIPTRGPAKDPLPRFAITIDEWGRILVDKNRTFTQAQWTNVSAYLKLKK